MKSVPVADLVANLAADDDKEVRPAHEGSRHILQIERGRVVLFADELAHCPGSGTSFVGA